MKAGKKKKNVVLLTQEINACESWQQLEIFSSTHMFDEIVAWPIYGKQIFIVRNSLLSLDFR